MKTIGFRPVENAQDIIDEIHGVLGLSLIHIYLLVAIQTVDAGVPANVKQWNGTAVATPHTNGYPVVTIRDGTGTGEIDTSGGKVMLQDGAITAAVIAGNAVDADALAADAGAEIAAAVWANAARTLTATLDPNAATIAAAVWLSLIHI